MAFVKGQSGNPGGRPKQDPEVRRLAKALTVEAIGTLADVMRNKRAPAAARVSAAEALLNRGWGKPSQAVEVQGPDGGPVQVGIGAALLSSDAIAKAQAALLRAIADACDAAPLAAPTEEPQPET